MKKLFSLFTVLTIAAMLFVGCSNPNGGGKKGNDPFAGTTWKQSLNGELIANGTTISFASSGKKVTVKNETITEFTYSVENSNTAVFSFQETKVYEFVIDENDSKKAHWANNSYLEFTKQ